MKTKRKSKRKSIIITSFVLALVLISAIAIPGFVGAQNSNAPAKSTGNTKTQKVSTQDIQKIITGTGQIVTGDEQTITLSDTKKVNKLLVSQGQAVKIGDALLSYTNGTKLKSTINGVVKTITIAANTLSGDKYPSISDNIIIMNTDNLTTELSVDETDLQNVAIGQVADITINALTGQKYTGKVTKISETGTYTNGNSTFKVTITLDKTEKVKIGMSADVEIVIASVKGVVAVPIEAVIGSGDNAKVMVISGDGSASPVSVKLGLANDAFVQITSGLSEGETIQYIVQSSASTAGGFGMQFNGNRQGTAGAGLQGIAKSAAGASQKTGTGAKAG